MKGKIETVTPTMAAKWLEQNSKNRTLRPVHVRRIESDMLAGRFLPHHQGIALDEHGLLLDGQHRLTAIVQAGKPVDVFVVRGVSRAAAAYIDSLMGRSVTDGWKMSDREGAPPDSKATAIARIYALMPTAKNKTRSQNYLNQTRFEHMEVFERYRQAIEWAASVAANGSLCAGSRAAMARAWYYMDDPSVFRLEELIKAGVSNGAHESAVIVWRNYINTNSGRGGTIQNDRYARAQNAIWKFMNGTAATKSLAVFDDLFPLTTKRMAQL